MAAPGARAQMAAMFHRPHGPLLSALALFAFGLAFSGPAAAQSDADSVFDEPEVPPTPRSYDPKSALVDPIDGCAVCPVNPVSGAELLPPYGDVVVFIAAHPDDETIGMAAAIMEQVQQGKRVFIELMTHGETSNVINTLHNGGTDSWHSGTHGYNLTVGAFGAARVRELVDSATRMGVAGVAINAFPSGALTSAQVASRIAFWAQNAAHVELRGVAASAYLDPGSPGGQPHVDHVAVWDAIFAATSIPDRLGYLVYHYHTNAGHPTYTATYGAALCAAKRNALDAYKVWLPSAGRYAIGFHSTPYLMDTNNVPDPPTSCEEFVVVP